MPPKRVPIIEKKLGRDGVHGWAYYKPPKIEIDSRLRGKKQQEILLHELLHIALPQLAEETILETGIFLSDHTWRFGLRRIESEPRKKRAPKKADSGSGVEPDTDPAQG